jgi:hypothetical protein
MPEKVDMYMEFQFSAEFFAKVVRNRIRALHFANDEEYDLNGFGMRVIDKVTLMETKLQREMIQDAATGKVSPASLGSQVVWIYSPKSLRAIDAQFLQVSQGVRVHLVTTADMDARGIEPSPALTITIYPVYNVALAVTRPGSGGAVQMTFQLAYVDYSYFHDALPAEQREKIRKAISAIVVPPITLDLGSLTGAIGSKKMLAYNAGIALTSDENAVAMRVDFDVTDTPPSIDRAFFSQGPHNRTSGREWAALLDKEFLVRSLTTGVESALGEETKLSMTSKPVGDWLPFFPGSSARVEAELLDFCPFPVSDIDLDVEIFVVNKFSMVPGTPEALRIRVESSGRAANIGEEFLCAVSAAHLWPYAGARLLLSENAGQESRLAYGLLYVLEPIALSGLLFGGLVLFEKSVSSAPGGEGRKPNCSKTEDGAYECDYPIQIAIPGGGDSRAQMRILGVDGADAGLVLSGRTVNFSELAEKTVVFEFSPFEWRMEGNCRLDLRIENSAKITVSGTGALINAYVLPGTDPYDEFAVSVSDKTVVVKPSFRAGYVASPYPCKLRLATSAGIRTVTIPPPIAITDQEKDYYEALMKNLLDACRRARDAFYQPERIVWRVPPRPSEERLIADWQVAVHGMASGEILAINSEAGETLLEANPSQDGFVHVRLLLEGDSAFGGLDLEIKGRELNRRRRSLTWFQVAYAWRASIEVSDALRLMRFEGKHLVVENNRRRMLWNIGDAHRPFLLAATHAPQQESDSRMMWHQGRRIVEMSSDGWRQNIDAALSKMGSARDADAIGSLRLGGFERTLYVRCGSDARLFYATDGGDVREIQRYAGRAWFEGTAFGGRLMAKYDRDSGTIDIFSALSSEHM